MCKLIQVSFFLVLALFLSSGVSSAGDVPREVVSNEDMAAVLAKRLDALHARINVQIGLAETLREAGRIDEALRAYEEAKQIYTTESAKIDRWVELLVSGRNEDDATPTVPSIPLAGRGGHGRTQTAGTKKLDDAVDSALRWLAAHQSPNGGWEAAGFTNWCDGKPQVDLGRQPDGQGKAVYDVGITGLALCAFLGAGYTNRGKHDFARVIGKGLRYLKNVQDPEGCFGPRSSQQYIYNHAAASLAMVEVYGMTGSPIFKGSAQRALDFGALARNPYYGWRYGIKPGDNDTSVTGWMMMGLKSAKIINDHAIGRDKPAPLTIDESAFDGVREWMGKVTDPDYGRAGYLSRGSGSARPQELLDRFPAEKSEAMTAVSILGRIFAGADPSKDKSIQKGGELLRRVPPVWNPNDGSIDMYYWYMGTLAAFQIGGKVWATWNTAVKDHILENQRKDGDFCGYKGSWDPMGPWGPDGGRIYATALMAMCAQVNYRYDRVFGTK